ncbi:MAG: 50S ribosomal protein L1 [Piscirickettsiaceae bacterium]|nr:50S ribosomal protein L1 [Piscirickettsiaceae bacterium]
MAVHSKRIRAIYKKFEMGRTYSVERALTFVKDNASAKFVESIDVAINLGVDPRKSDQVVRGSTLLPNGIGKTVRVAVFAQGVSAETALAAGADIVGLDDLAESIKAGNVNFDVIIASPDTMRVVGTLGQVLGPRGLMPNPKVGTITSNLAEAIKNAKSGQVRYRADKAGIVHCSIGIASFKVKALQQNLETLLDDLNKLKPNSSKGIYIKLISVSSTMGIGVMIDRSFLG